MFNRAQGRSTKSRTDAFLGPIDIQPKRRDPITDRGLHFDHVRALLRQQTTDGSTRNEVGQFNCRWLRS